MSQVDGFDLSQAVLEAGSPDVHAWPIATTITAISLQADGLHVDFDRQDGPEAWPNVVYPGWDGPLQFTLWLFVRVDGHWHGGGIIEFWNGRPSTGSWTQPTFAQHVAENWIRDAHWSVAYQPIPGDLVGVMVTQGNERNTLQHTIEARSAVVLVPFPAAPPMDLSPTLPSPMPVPDPPPGGPPVPPTPTPAPSGDSVQAQLVALAQRQADDTATILAAIADLKAHIDTAARRIGDTYLPMVFKFVEGAQTPAVSGTANHTAETLVATVLNNAIKPAAAGPAE